MADTPITVVGAGVVGLAVAARLAREHSDVVLLERQPRHGQETSSRNSEVIHAGIYYAEGSLKAQLCVEGNRRLYEYCERRGVPCRRTGKLISATRVEELDRLEELLERGRGNGAPLSLITAAQARRLEPAIRSEGALDSPSSGIVSAHGLMDALLHEARSHGTIVQLANELLAVERRGSEYALSVRSGTETETFTSERLVNSAGLDADLVAALCGIDPDEAGYRLHFCKGSYFSVRSKRSGLLSRLVYPVPQQESLGVHAVLGLEGRLRFGPDAEYLDGRDRDYTVDPAKLPAFGTAVRQLIPSLEDEDLAPDMAGIRPKLQAQGAPPRDFVIAEESARGLPGLVNLVGIDSPGLTSAIAIAEHVAGLIGD